MKFCSKCGNANSDDSVFCASCGTALDQAPAAQPEAAPAYTAPAYEAPAYNAAYAAPATPSGEVKNTATLWLILNIVSTILCCGGLWTIGGIIFAAIGSGAYKKGDIEGMKGKAKIAMILFIVGTVLGLLVEIGLIIAASLGVFNSIIRGY